MTQAASILTLHGFVSFTPSLCRNVVNFSWLNLSSRLCYFSADNTQVLSKNRESTHRRQTKAKIYYSPSSFCFWFSSYSCQSYPYSGKHTTYIYSCNWWMIPFAASSLSCKSTSGFASSSRILVDFQVGKWRQGRWGLHFLQWQHCLLGVRRGRCEEVCSRDHRLLALSKNMKWRSWILFLILSSEAGA